MEEKKFDFNSFIGFALIGGILFYMMYQNQPVADQSDSKIQKNTDLNSPKTGDYNSNSNKPKSILKNDNKYDNSEVFSRFTDLDSIGKDFFTTIENEVLEIKVSNKGGTIEEIKLKDYVTHDSVPVYLVKNGSSKFNLKFYTSNAQMVKTQDLFFDPSLEKRFNETILSMKSNISDTKFLEFRYSLKTDDYMIGFSINSKGLSEVIDRGKSPEFNWDLNAISHDQSISFENRYTRLSYEHDGGKNDKLSASGNDNKNINDISWISYRQHFFSSIMVPEKNIKRAQIESEDLTNQDDVDLSADLIALKKRGFNLTKRYKTKFPLELYKGRIDHKFGFYFGPTYAKILQKYDRNLESSIPFGWGIFGWINRSIFSPLYAWLSSFLPYGIAIIVMTIMVKILLSFVQYKQFLSQAKMKILKPELDAIRAKYKNNKMKAQQETMSLQNRAGASPLSGCLPGLLQIPVFYSLFMFFPIAFELRQKPFLWVDDLSSYDKIIDLPFYIPLYGDHVSLFPILASVAIFFYMKMTTGQNTAMQAPPQEGMPDMAKMMKYMIYFSPILMLFFFNQYASGLSLYYFVSNLISIGIMLVIKNYIIDEEKVLARIEVNRSKPKKQSRFQKKMAEIMEQAEKHKQMQKNGRN